MLKVGFIGLGSMGTKMSKNIIKNGFDLMVYNRTKSKKEELIKLGAKSASTPAEMGAKCNVIVTCLPDDKIERDYIFGKDGLLGSNNPLFKYFISCSTIDVTAAKKIGDSLKERGIYYFDSPVSGGPKGAEEGTLTIMVGGNEDVFNQENINHPAEEVKRFNSFWDQENYRTELIDKFLDAPIVVYPGENEMESLARGALEGLKGKEEIKDFN